MSLATTVVSFGEWLPDLTELGEGLSEALNVYPSNDYYLPHRRLTNFFQPGVAVVPSTALGLTWAAFGAVDAFYVGTATQIYMSDASGTLVARTATLASVSIYEWDFAQYDDLVIATQDQVVPQAHTIKAASNFATLSAEAPRASFVGVIGQFVMLGRVRDASNTLRATTVRWSSIDQPNLFPPPNSATATATQAGEQTLDARYGEVLRIVSGDQFGMVFQQSAITRVTYIGPPSVFQFDVFEVQRGLIYPTAVCRVGQSTYYLSKSGFFQTDGVQVVPVGEGKVDKTYLALLNSSTTKAAYDANRQCVVFGSADGVYFFNIKVGRWAHASEDPQALLSSLRGSGQAFAVNSSRELTYFNGNMTTMQLLTRETELNPGGFTRVLGVKPMVEDATLNAVTASVYFRNDRFTAATNTSNTTATARTGFADFIAEARYMAAALTISGSGNTPGKIHGIEIKAIPTSQT